MTFASRALLAAVVVVPLAAPIAGCLAPPKVGDPYPLPYWVLDKSLFDEKNEWWLQRTMTQVPYEAGFSFVGDADFTDRVHFKIEENFLIAYRSQDVWFADGSDVSTAPDTAPSLVFPILKQVDIVDGQQIEPPNEPWYNRTHIIVDWGNEQSDSYRFTLGRVATTGVKFWTSDPSDPEEAPIFEPDYIDFTSHVVVAPSQQFDPVTNRPDFCSPQGIGSELFDDAVNCSPMDVAFRTSLRRVPADDDYEVLKSDDPSMPPLWFDRFFRVARGNIDEEYGLTLPGRVRTVSRFNIWEQSTNAGKRIALKDRVVKPIVFHLSTDFPPDLKDVAQQAIDAWNATFIDTVQQARAAECVDGGGDESNCQKNAVKPDRVVVLCQNNPTKKGDDALCGPAGTLVRLGDLRFNMIDWVKQPNVTHPVGLAWWSPDLVTGETVAGHAKIYGEEIDKSAAWARDAILVASGALKPDDVASGAYLGNYAPLLQAYSVDPYGTSQPPPPAKIPPAPALDVGPANPDGTAPPAIGLFRDNAFAPVVGSNVEPVTLDPDSFIMAGLDPDTSTDSASLASASELRTALSDRSEARRTLAQMMAVAGGDLDLPADPDLGSVIDAVGSSDGDKIYTEVRRRFAFTVMAHELGHVFAIKHNFAGSYDALNYQPGYWANREQTCLGPRYDCPLTADEQKARLEDFAYSSIMDYHPSANSYDHGLGYYDQAAIHALYGGVVEVFSDTTLKSNQNAVLTLQGTYGHDQVAHIPLIQFPDANDPRGYHMGSFHYSKYPSIFGDLSKRTYVSAKSLTDQLGVGIPNADPKGRFMVPYNSCNDVEEGELPYCFAYDHGADPFEIVTAQTNWFKTYYAFNSFRRGRLTFEPTQYIRGMWSRVFLPLKRWDDWLTHTHFDYDQTDPGAYTDSDFLEPMQKASDFGFQFLSELIATPEPGSYFTTPQPDGTTMLAPFEQPISHVVPVPSGAVMSIDFPQGRTYQSVAAYDAGLILLNVGSAVDKELALEALLDPSFFSFPGRSSWDQTELWMVNYYNTHPDQVLDVIGSMVAGDWGRLGGRYTTDVKYRNFLDVTSTQPGQIVSPAIGFNLRIRALIYGIGLIYSGYADRSFLESVRVVEVGTGEEPVGITSTPVDFTDPATGKQYRAYSQQVNGVEIGVGARVLTQAQAIVDTINNPATTPAELDAARTALLRQIDLIEIMRSTVDKFDAAGFTGVNPDSLGP